MIPMIQTLILESKTQLNIFFLILNHPKGIEIQDICLKLNTPRTTIIDNLKKLYNRKYINYYEKYFNKVGRPIKYYYIPKWLYEKFLEIKIPKIILNGVILNDNNN